MPRRMAQRTILGTACIPDRVRVTYSCRGQLMHAEQLARIRPHPARAPIGRSGEVLELGHRILVRVLGMDALSRAKGNAPTSDLGALLPQADEVHFDPPIARIVDGLVLERLQVEVGADLRSEEHTSELQSLRHL